MSRRVSMPGSIEHDCNNLAAKESITSNLGNRTKLTVPDFSRNVQLQGDIGTTSRKVPLPHSPNSASVAAFLPLFSYWGSLTQLPGNLFQLGYARRKTIYIVKCYRRDSNIRG